MRATPLHVRLRAGGLRLHQVSRGFRNRASPCHDLQVADSRVRTCLSLEPGKNIFELISVMPGLCDYRSEFFWNSLVLVIIDNDGLPNPWVYLSELFCEFCSVISVEEFPNPK